MKIHECGTATGSIYIDILGEQGLESERSKLLNCAYAAREEIRQLLNVGLGHEGQ